ncbi:hypothetical protein FPF71_03580 [Algibacter amylolyticus]|uniref:Lipocalin-like domain-containing protein n=1 Tax=Algibacter amylolyticus TaxID=1608400 RepID=A0A5M7BKG6_9FLAO|nr:hypothetical protein [Algibacter amylolyticus]KAA5827934.1 hypothetical protein F2B50_03580 [Algibacter amylolyticus]MBB5267168.1 hypothetical protein [Algibacter amylolyticus]TSJ82179.1 hypothetical protein FPF71_03580 [Algibacter amylolyticus]
MLSKTLKRVVLLFLFSTTIFSCESSDDTLDTSGELPGNWELISYTNDGSTSTNFQGNPLRTTFTGKAINIDYILTFTENPNKAFTENSSLDFEITSSANGTSSTETSTINNITSESDWSRDGNILTFSGDFGSFNTSAPVIDDEISANPEYIIKELTENTLVLTTGVSEQVSESGFDIDIDVNLRLEFTRI